VSDFLDRRETPIVDLRDGEDFEEMHIIHASSFPVECLSERRYELPPQSVPLRLVGTPDQLEEAIEFLKGYSFEACISWNTQAIEVLKQRDVLVSGAESKVLWKPARIVQKFCDRTEQRDGSDRWVAPARRRALDIGAGAGRDSVHLAMNGWDVNSIDNQQWAIDRLELLANRHNVSVKPYLLDVEADEDVLDQIPGSFDLVVIVRYLYRPLFPAIKKKISPGGFMVMQTFMEGCEKFKGPKKARFLLKKNELAELFSDEFVVLEDMVEYLDDGRPTNVFIAQKTATTQ